MNKDYGSLQNRVEMQLMSIGENVALARMVVSGMVVSAGSEGLNLTVSQLEEIKVAVSEAVSNAIIHGYNSAPDRRVGFEISLYKRALVIVVDDSGVGIEDVSAAMQPSFSTKPERMGLGFAFMSSFMDEVEVESALGSGTKVILIKKLPIEEVSV